MKYMTAKEEDILSNINFIKKGTAIDKLMQSLIVDKKINYRDLLVGDKNAIMVAARILSYGQEYTFTYDDQEYKVDLSKVDNTKTDIALCSKGKILETGTSNIIFVKNNKYFSPINRFYKGVNLKFFDKQFKIKKTNIYIDSLSQYEEILLIGSGKGVSTVKSVKEKNWNRKNYKSYENFMKKYKSKIMQQKILSNYL